jgi:hypothetical protein
LEINELVDVAPERLANSAASMLRMWFSLRAAITDSSRAIRATTWRDTSAGTLGSSSIANAASAASSHAT